MRSKTDALRKQSVSGVYRAIDRRPATVTGYAVYCMREPGDDPRASTGGGCSPPGEAYCVTVRAAGGDVVFVGCRTLSLDGCWAEVLPTLIPSGGSGRRDCRVLLLRTVVSFLRLGVCCPGGALHWFCNCFL